MDLNIRIISPKNSIVKKIGRYKNVFAGENQRKVSLYDFFDQRGVYNVKKVCQELKKFTGQTENIKIIDGNISYNYGKCWYKGWLIVENKK